MADRCPINTTELARVWVDHPGLLHGIAGLYIVTALGSVVGNSGVLVVILGKKDMRSVTNIFIAALASTDLILTSTTFWITPLAFTQRQFRFGEAMCYVTMGLGAACFFWTPFILSAMALDRYALIMRPLQMRIARIHCAGLVLLIWLSGLLMVAPSIYHVQYVSFGECGAYCVEAWRDPGRLLYGALVLLVRSVVPFILITFCHFQIARRLRAQRERLDATRTEERRTLEEARRTRLERVLFMMVLVFALSTFPLDLYNLIQDLEMAYGLTLMGESVRPPVHLVTFLVAMSGTLWNPLIYAWWNENLKREMLNALDCSQKRFSLTAAAIVSRSVLGRRSLGSRVERNEAESLLGNYRERRTKPSLNPSTKPSSLQSYSSMSDGLRLGTRSGTLDIHLRDLEKPRGEGKLPHPPPQH